MQFLIVFIPYLFNTQHVTSDIRSSSGVLFTAHTASGYLCYYLSVALSCVHNTQHVSSDIRSSSGVLFTVHTASGYM
jgi:phosphoenolpyruvate synthase/pyruvate phosphate dikinase